MVESSVYIGTDGSLLLSVALSFHSIVVLCSLTAGRGGSGSGVEMVFVVIVLVGVGDVVRQWQ